MTCCRNVSHRTLIDALATAVNQTYFTVDSMSSAWFQQVVAAVHTARAASFRKFVQKIQASFKHDKKKTSILHEDLFLFKIMYRRIPVRMRNVSNFVQSTKTQFILSNFFFSENRALYQIMWKGVVEPEGPQMIT